MYFLIASFLFSSSLVFAANSISTFPITFGNPPASANVLITWGEDTINGIQIKDASGKLIQSLDASGDWTNLGLQSDHTRKNIVRSVDANFDGYTDLLIESSRGTAGQLFRLFKYDPSSKQFKLSKALDEVWNPSFDEKKRLVEGGANDMKKMIYVWEGDSLKKL